MECTLGDLHYIIVGYISHIGKLYILYIDQGNMSSYYILGPLFLGLSTVIFTRTVSSVLGVVNIYFISAYLFNVKKIKIILYYLCFC
jgi:hypothetical protein